MTNKLVKINTGLQEYQRIKDIPENLKRYTVIMMDKNEYEITGDVKEIILKSPTNFIELKSGDVINKAVISQIKLNLNQLNQKEVSIGYGEMGGNKKIPKVI
jgi:hypothetical protein